VRVGKKFYFDGGAGESGSWRLGQAGERKGQTFWNPCLEHGASLLHFFSLSTGSTSIAEKRKSVVLKVGLRTPNIGLATGTFFAIEEDGADFSFGNFWFRGSWLQNN
jgi:hypothetical protein